MLINIFSIFIIILSWKKSTFISTLLNMQHHLAIAPSWNSPVGRVIFFNVIFEFMYFFAEWRFLKKIRSSYLNIMHDHVKNWIFEMKFCWLTYGGGTTDSTDICNLFILKLWLFDYLFQCFTNRFWSNQLFK